MDYFLIGLVLVLTTVSQLLQKLGAVKVSNDSDGKSFLIKALTLWEIRWAIILLAAATGVWFAVIYQMEISKAFPFLSLTFVLVTVLSRFYLHESVPATRWVGAILIVIGVSMVSMT